MRHSSTLLALALCANYGCSSSLDIPNAQMGAPPGPLKTQFESLASTVPKLDFSNPAALECHDLAPSGFTEVALERTGCYGYCPEYTVTMFSDGRIEFEGRANIPTVGSRTGKGDSYTFEILATLLKTLVPNEPVVRYQCLVTDHETVYISYVRDGKRFFVEHYAPELTSPASLWAFEELFDALVTARFLR